MNRIIFLLSFALLFAKMSGQTTFSANRPGQVDNPDIVPGGNFMIETGFQYGENKVVKTSFFRLHR